MRALNHTRKIIAASALVTLLATAVGQLLQAVPVRAEPTVLFLPGGVMDCQTGVAYVTDGEGKIVAIETATGRELWRPQCTRELHVSSGARPLLLEGNRLYVQLPTERSDVAQIAVLDRRQSGKVLARSQPVKLTDNLCCLSRSWARLERGLLVYTWEVESTGANNLPATRRSSVAINLEDGNVAARDADAPMPAPRLSAKVAEIAAARGWTQRDEQWRLTPFPAAQVGKMAFGTVSERVLTSFFYSRIHYLEAVDSETGKLLWQRPIHQHPE